MSAAYGIDQPPVKQGGKLAGAVSEDTVFGILSVHFLIFPDACFDLIFQRGLIVRQLCREYPQCDADLVADLPARLLIGSRQAQRRAAVVGGVAERNVEAVFAVQASVAVIIYLRKRRDDAGFLTVQGHFQKFLAAVPIAETVIPVDGIVMIEKVAVYKPAVPDRFDRRVRIGCFRQRPIEIDLPGTGKIGHVLDHNAAHDHKAVAQQIEHEHREQDAQERERGAEALAPVVFEYQ